MAWITATDLSQLRLTSNTSVPVHIGMLFLLPILSMLYFFNMRESHLRSIVKGVTWRFIASATTMTVVYLVTGDVALTASVGVIDVSLKLFFYYCHERAWGKVKWGRLGVEPQFTSDR